VVTAELVVVEAEVLEQLLEKEMQERLTTLAYASFDDILADFNFSNTDSTEPSEADTLSDLSLARVSL
jgi:hypothetical protein